VAKLLDGGVAVGEQVIDTGIAPPHLSRPLHIGESVDSFEHAGLLLGVAAPLRSAGVVGCDGGVAGVGVLV
jgi:hypothetical protein